MHDVTATPLPQLSPREPESHKGTYGRVLIIGGSRGMAGAPALAGMAALRSGAGLVTVAVPESVQSTVASFEPSYMTVGHGRFSDHALGVDCKTNLHELAEKMTAIALGPGLGTGTSTKQLVCELYQTFEQPMVIDADALNALAEFPQRLENPGGIRILTPHPGEFERLMGSEVACEPDQRCGQVARLCERDASGWTIVVLKGHRTIVTNGQHYAVNHTGNPGMATGGTGDCLTGVIASFLGQGLSPFEAARLGAHVHGLAGDLAAQELGQVSMVASDLVKFLPAAFKQCTA